MKELEQEKQTVLFEIEKQERFCLEGIANPVLDETIWYNYQGKLTTYDSIKKLFNPQQ